MKTLNYNIIPTTSIFTDNNDYSKILDNIILDTVINNNDYLFNTKKKEEDTLISKMMDKICTFNFGKSKKDEMSFAEACAILANIGKKKNYYGLRLNHTYYLEDGTPIIFFDDEIKIGKDYYDYCDFASPIFIKGFKPEMKKKITKITIDIKL